MILPTTQKALALVSVEKKDNKKETRKDIPAAAKKELGKKYDTIQKRLNEVSRQYEETLSARSRVIKELYDAIGSKPFERGGRQFRAICRGEGVNAIYFLREYKAPEGVESLD